MIIELCLATAIFFEARNQTFDGQRAVAEVILNRRTDPQWPDNICDIIEQPRQFSYTHDGLSDNPLVYDEGDAWWVARMIARETIQGKDLLGITSTHYHTTAVSPSWRHALELDGQIGDHIFYSKRRKK